MSIVVIKMNDVFKNAKFVTYLTYRRMLDFLKNLRWKIYYLFGGKKETKLISDPTKDYMDAKLEAFVSSFKNCDVNWSSNIDSIVYDRENLNCFLQNPNDIEKQWKTRLLFENTTRGNVIMYYDLYKDGFAYYSDSSCLPYGLLNAVAMKYVLKYRCRDFFVDEAIENVKSTRYVTMKIEEEEKEKEKLDKSNTNYIKNSDVFLKGKVNRSEKAVISEEKKQTRDEMRNKFLYLGKLSNFSMLQKIPKKRVLPAYFLSQYEDLFQESPNISYKDYKTFGQVREAAIVSDSVSVGAT